MVRIINFILFSILLFNSLVYINIQLEYKSIPEDVNYSMYFQTADNYLDNDQVIEYMSSTHTKYYYSTNQKYSNYFTYPQLNIYNSQNQLDEIPNDLNYNSVLISSGDDIYQIEKDLESLLGVEITTHEEDHKLLKETYIYNSITTLMWVLLITLVIIFFNSFILFKNKQKVQVLIIQGYTKLQVIKEILFELFVYQIIFITLILIYLTINSSFITSILLIPLFFLFIIVTLITIPLIIVIKQLYKYSIKKITNIKLKILLSLNLLILIIMTFGLYLTINNSYQSIKYKVNDYLELKANEDKLNDFVYTSGYNSSILEDESFNYEGFDDAGGFSVQVMEESGILIINITENYFLYNDLLDLNNQNIKLDDQPTIFVPNSMSEEEYQKIEYYYSEFEVIKIADDQEINTYNQSIDNQDQYIENNNYVITYDPGGWSSSYILPKVDNYQSYYQDIGATRYQGDQEVIIIADYSMLYQEQIESIIYQIIQFITKTFIYIIFYLSLFLIQLFIIYQTYKKRITLKYTIGENDQYNKFGYTVILLGFINLVVSHSLFFTISITIILWIICHLFKLYINKDIIKSIREG